MIRNAIRKVLNKFNYDIVKLKYTGSEKYKTKDSNTKGLTFYDTPTGKYYLPAHLKNDHVMNKIKSGVYFEPEVIEIAKQYIKKDTVVLDVGANYGQMTIFFSSLAGGGSVFSF